ncbi:hypothetical protein SDC9_209606 [bioreactor metagenome]|uniref:Uncharacterized protein n=1 Tax=bioreactor metagenome TaxID=1076179 RepID=A0A645JE42_9ZZZZ
MQNTLSLQFKFVPTREIKTPRLLPISPIRITAIPTTPALMATPILTCAPTNTNKSISAKIHILFSFKPSLFPTCGIFSKIMNPIVITPKSPAISILFFNKFSRAVSNIEAPMMSNTFLVSLI